MTDQGHLSEGKFSYIVRWSPLPSLDLIIRDSDGRVLVGLRTDEPAKKLLFCSRCLEAYSLWKRRAAAHAASTSRRTRPEHRHPGRLWACGELGISTVPLTPTLLPPAERGNAPSSRRRGA